MKRIILVDDCRLTLAMGSEILVDAGYEVIAAESGMAANQFLFRKPRPHLILVDVEMPMVAGNQFVGLLKGEPCLHGVPIILMSHKDEPEMKRLCSESGADGYILKPLRTPVLLQLLAQYP